MCGFFARHRISEVHPCCQVNRDLFSVTVVSNYMDVPQFVPSVSNWGASGLFPVRGCYSCSCEVFECVCVVWFLLDKNRCGISVLRRVCVSLCEKLPNQLVVTPFWSASSSLWEFEHFPSLCCQVCLLLQLLVVVSFWFYFVFLWCPVVLNTFSHTDGPLIYFPLWSAF